jgi:P27 family predicted phage terminase small subunit
MVTGRKPKPTPLKVIEGTDRPDRVNANEPKPKKCIPKAPKEMTKRVKKYWPKIAKQLNACGILTELDANALGAYCEMYLRWTDANKKLEKHGLIVLSPSKYPIQSPYLAISNKALEQMQKIAVEFGMTPSSRSRIQVPDGDEGGNEFDNI